MTIASPTEFLPRKPFAVPYRVEKIDPLEHLQRVLDDLDDDPVRVGSPCRSCVGGEYIERRFNEPQCYLVGDIVCCDRCGEIAQ